MKSKIHYTKPSISEKEVEYAADAATSGWGEHCYNYIIRFEEAFRVHIGAKHVLATSSCTGALHMGLAALGIEQGDEVIMADTNWIATAAPIVHLGAKPIFVDVLPDTWCINPDAAEAAITPHTKAILAVHLYGNLCRMNELLSIGKRYGIPVVEDAAGAIGSSYRDKRAGSIGRFGVFSFHGTKTITTGEGGMFVTNDTDLYEQVLTISNHGRAKDQEKQFWSDSVGFKYKMSNLQAAIGCAQMERIQFLLAEKRRVFMAYQDNLADLPLTMNPETTETTNGYWMPTIVVDDDVPFDRDKIVMQFQPENISTRVFFWPLSMLPMFDSKPENKECYRLYNRAINLPSYSELTKPDILRVTHIIRKYLQA